jgi:hypothetical protein
MRDLFRVKFRTIGLYQGNPVVKSSGTGSEISISKFKDISGTMAEPKPVSVRDNTLRPE